MQTFFLLHVVSIYYWWNSFWWRS